MNNEHFRPEFQHAFSAVQSLLFSADKLKALGVEEHFPFSVKMSVEANRKSQRSENEITYYFTQYAYGDRR